MGLSGGGVFLPGDPPPSTNQVLTTPTITGGTVSGATITGGTQTSTGSTFTSPTITSAVISGATTVASGATITTPTLSVTTQIVTATGTGSGDAASVSAIVPAYISITGATGSGVNLPTGPIGALYWLGNDAAATMRIYSVGGTINGTTGTTAFTLTSTGNKLAMAFNTSASGVWEIKGNT
jgi:hypothetical protein